MRVRTILDTRFFFPSLALYESYRSKIPGCPKCQEALEYSTATECILSFERNFFKPIFEGIEDKAKLFLDEQI
jgi:hypothetical protein